MVLLLCWQSFARFVFVKLLAPKACGDFDEELNGSLEKLSRGELEPLSDSAAEVFEKTSVASTPLAEDAAGPAEV